ncbi:restriction endonuclease subunit S [Kaistella carnis]|uniref:restriction endonuclease subunit S n=1 Tax=Kaistella carnis TaxID=1241979 RepID=UPI0028A76986|nr:restriction endonuclease subunit S [Kaistella carnis]
MTWVTKKIKDVALVTAGQSPEGKHYNSNGHGLPFFQGKKEFGDKFIGEAKVWTSFVTKIAEEGDILMSVRAPVGPVNFAIEKCCIGRGLAAIRVKERFDKDFLFLYFKHIEHQLTGNAGAVFNSINKGQIEDLDIPMPSFLEQKALVEKLDFAFDAIEKAKANIKKNVENAKELLQSKLNAIFTQKSEGWEEKTLNEISKNLDSKRIPITKNVRTEGAIPYYGASGIVDYVEDFIFDGTYLLISEDGANLLARTYPIAFSVDGKFWVNNHAHILEFKDFVTQKFVEYYLNSIKLDNYVTGMAQPKLSQTSLNKIIVPIPVNNIKEQEKIVAKLDFLSNQTKLLQEKYKHKLANLEELKKSILEKAFKGELV